MNPRMPRHIPIIRRRLQCESLEARYTLNGDGDFLQNAQSLTLSFAPDGTHVSDEVSALSVAFASKIPNWQEVIVRAFQTWAQNANINVGVVADGSQPLGIQGQAHFDTRFGDIRIAGVPLALDTYGEAIHETRTMVGTWSGDVVFNTAAPINTEADLFSVALHEAGHVLGLDHSIDPLSPMHQHGISTTAGPTADDISNLRTAYGARRADVFDAAQRNESIQKAARIPHAEPIDGFTGATPLLVYGDVLNASDKDVYELPLLPGYSGSLSIDLVTRGISELAGRLTVMDRDGTVLGQVVTSKNVGDKVTVNLTTLPTGKLYLQVDAPNAGLFSSGAYAVVTRYDQLLTTPAASIDAKVLEGYHWQARTDESDGQVDVSKLLSSGVITLDDDQHQDDSPTTAVILREIIDTSELRKFQVVGTITDAIDFDSYRVRSPSNPLSPRGLTVTVESLEDDGLIPLVTVLDKTGVPVPVQYVVNGNGQLTIRAAGIEDNKDYFIQVSGAGGSKGNYSLVARYDAVDLVRTSATAGQLTAALPAMTSTLYVARPQLFSFALSSTPGATPSGAIWATVVDSANRNVAFVGSGVGQFRSAAAVLLEPGTYSIVVEARDASGGMNPDASFVFYADRVSDPVGPPQINPGTEPAFSCGGLSGLFCFPSQPPTSNPVVITAPTTPVNAPSAVPVALPTDGWFWNGDFLPTNPLQPLDANGDTRITAFDAIGIINFLNQFGASSDLLGPRMTTYMDVNGDGRISAFDAISVITYLNLHPTGEPASGGEAVPNSAGEAVAEEQRLALLLEAAEQANPQARNRPARVTASRRP